MISAPLLVILVGFPIIGILLPFVAYTLSQQDKFWGTVPEGQLRIVVSSGQFLRAFANVKGWHINNPKDRNYDNRYPDWQMIPEINGRWGAPGYTSGQEDCTLVDTRSFLARRFGIYWFGIYPLDEVLVYSFAWNKWKEADGSYELIPRRENVKVIFFQYPYAIRLIGLEMREYFPITLNILAKVRIINPERAFYKTSPPGNWLTLVVVAIEAATRDFVSGMNPEQLAAINFSDPNDATMPVGSFIHWVLAVNRRLAEIGVEIYGLEVKGFEVEEDEVNQALKAQELARQKGQALVVAAEQAALARTTQAKGEATAIVLEGDARAKATEKLGEAILVNPGVASVLVAQAVSNSKVTTWVQNGGVGVNLPLPAPPPNTP